MSGTRRARRCDNLRALPLALLGRGKFLAAELRESAALLEEAVPLLER
ncbi:MAG: hypothetical protein M3252_02165 [Actinomycetota bacterium]|nr:hypothetical protein [Actinomycetota bacterium]